MKIELLMEDYFDGIKDELEDWFYAFFENVFTHVDYDTPKKDLKYYYFSKGNSFGYEDIELYSEPDLKYNPERFILLDFIFEKSKDGYYLTVDWKFDEDDKITMKQEINNQKDFFKMSEDFDEKLYKSFE